jgi:uncharacterized protein DUF3562
VEPKTLDVERIRHRKNAEQLAREEGVSIDVVEPIYVAELAQVGQSARIREFVPVLVANRVKRALRRIKQETASL